ncbi:MAG: hypothetical protein HZB16_12845 [Armatimonadetes bacterium]|nr:hypothetical protein [Armatimonadota bacterium]
MVRWAVLLMLATLTAVSAAEVLYDKDGLISDKSKRLPSGEWAEVVSVKAKPNQLITVTVAAKGFTPYLIITPPNGQQVDRRGEGTDVSVSFLCLVEGDAAVVVTTAGPTEKGAFHLTIRSGLLEGKLDEGCTVLESGEYSRVVPVWLPAGEYVVALGSQAFNPYLILHEGDREVNVDDDLGAANGAARALAQLTEPTLVGVQVTSHAKGEKGAWHLFIAPGIPALDQPRSAKGKLEKGDYDDAGRLSDSYSMVLAKGVKVRFTAKATGFVPKLVVYDGAGKRAEATVAGDTATLTLENSAAGTLQLLIQGQEPGTGGDYQLTAEADTSVAAPPAAGAGGLL